MILFNYNMVVKEDIDNYKIYWNNILNDYGNYKIYWTKF